MTNGEPSAYQKDTFTAPNIFTIAVLKGAMEGDISRHFASLFGLRQHIATAQALDLIEEDTETVTQRGHQIYYRYALHDLPDGRAYLAWANIPSVAAAIAGLNGGGEQ